MHPYHSVPYTILETFPPTCARYFLFMLSGLGSVAWQSSAVHWYSPGARLSPCRMWFYWVSLSLGASSQRCPVVTSGVTLSLVLHHQNSLLTGTFGPGACFNGCFACLKAANLFFGCFCDALGMLGRVVFSACNGQSSISVSRGALGAHGISRLVPLCSRMLSAPWGPTFHGLWASFGWEMAKMAMFWSGNAAVTLSIKPTHTFC